MKRLKEYIAAILILFFVGALIYFMYQRVSTRTNRELSKRIAELSPRGGPPETIEGLRQAIALYEAQIERNVAEGAQTGVYWKILATRLADRNMHNDALLALERALYFNPEDPVLYYLTGVSAAVTAKTKIGFSPDAQREKEMYFNLAENAYLRALDLDITYTRAMYGLGILYSFEMDRPNDAIVHLERYLQILPSDVSAMFVLARAHYMLENFQQAVDIYDRIITRTTRAKDQKLKEEAMLNRDAVQGMVYGGR